MLLAIDCGNTNVVFGVYDGDRKRKHWRLSTNAKRTADEYAVDLIHLKALEKLTPADIDGAIIASVVPAAVRNLKVLCQEHFGVTPLVIGEPGVELGITVKSQQAGADRLVNAVAGYRRYGGPLIIVDFGTATTFDVVGPDGSHEGAVLAPGINLSIEALYLAGDQLPRITIEPTETVIGTSTIPAMRAGIYWGYVDMIEGMIRRIRAETGWDMKVIATGGLASLFTEVCPSLEHVAPDLTLDGLAMIYQLNQAPVS